jgi:N-hydroxyarylamine O-acetyltransferase
MIRSSRLYAVAMSDFDVQGYLRRLDLEHPGPPSVEGLFALMRAQVERVPYTSLQIHLGRRTTPDPHESAARIIAGGGGYCYHLNGALSVLLEALGYDVCWHRGRVYVDPPAGPGVGPIAEEPNHLTLTVELDDDLWLVDTGLGDALHEPVPLAAGSTTQGPWTYSLAPRPTETGSGGWHFLHDPAAESFTGMVFEERIARLEDFTARHEWMETDPESNFVKKFDVYRRDALGVDSLRGLVLKRKGYAGTAEREIGSKSEWYTALADVFGLHLADVSEEEKDLLWKRVRSYHEEWTAQ